MHVHSIHSSSSCHTAPTPLPRREPIPARRSHRRRPRNPAPSSALLSLLATVVASSSSASAIPAPLPFLCPSIDSESYYDQHSNPPRDCLAALSQSSDSDSPQPTQHPPYQRRRLPDKYTQGEDGIWRRTGYTLYGSTIMCANCADPTPSVPLDDDSAEPSSLSSATSSPAATSTSLEDFLNTLPAGWKPLDRSDRTALILVISLVLAFFICFFIIGCIMWRKGLRRARDVERTLKKGKTEAEDDLTTLVEKELKVKRKVWARASARWRANARFTARQRRGKRRTVQALDSSSRHSVRDHDSDIEGPVRDDNRSHTTSRRSSISFTYPSPSVSPDTPARVTEIPPPPPLHISPPSSPPAYRRHSHTDLPSIQINDSSLRPDVPHKFAPEGSATLSSASSSRAQSRRPSHDSLDASPPSTDVQGTEELLAYSPSPHSAHVATDDKGLLERMTRMVSEPPSFENSGGNHTSSRHEYNVSAPVWDDDEMGEISIAESSQMAGTSSIHSVGLLFPPPPVPAASGKGKMTSYYNYEDTFGTSYAYDSYAYEQHSLDIEPEAEPSAPPFEPRDPESGDSLDDQSASAPPFELDDPESGQSSVFGFGPSAPPPDFDDENSSASTEVSITPDLPCPASQNHDWPETPSNAGPPPTPP